MSSVGVKHVVFRVTISQRIEVVLQGCPTITTAKGAPFNSLRGHAVGGRNSASSTKHSTLSGRVARVLESILHNARLTGLHLLKFSVLSPLCLFARHPI